MVNLSKAQKAPGPLEPGDRLSDWISLIASLEGDPRRALSILLQYALETVAVSKSIRAVCTIYAQFNSLEASMVCRPKRRAPLVLAEA